MRIYENRDNKSTFNCSYCHHEGHNKRHCPHMKAQWDANPQVHKGMSRDLMDGLISVDKSMFPPTYQRFWGDEDAKQQFRRHWLYMKDRFTAKPKAKPKKRKKAKCGFCGSTAHNRRNCNKLKNFIYVLNETNKAYRSQFYDRFIYGMGIGAGALLNIRNGDGDGVGLMTSFPTEKIMFTNLVKSWNDYHTRADVSLVFNGDSFEVNLSSNFLVANIYDQNLMDSLGIWGSMYSNWGRVNHVVSPAPNRPSKEWFLGQSPCFEWIVKKKTQTNLMVAFSHLIKEFYPHSNLRSKLGAKTYDQFYPTR